MASDSQTSGKDNNAPNTQSKSNINTDNPKNRITPTPSEPGPHPAECKQQITCETKRHWWDKAKPYVELGGVLLLAIYTGFTIAMYFANKKAADAAKDAADTARDALTSVQRAFVSFGGVILGTKVLDADNKRATQIRFDTPWENFGVTPTKDAQSHVSWLELPQDLPDGFGFPDIAPIQTSQFALPSKGVGHTTLLVPISTLERAKAGQARIFVWGWFTYRDIFKDTPIRLAEFCNEIINIKSGAPLTDPQAPISWDVTFCRLDHNCYDEQCKDYPSHTH